MKLILKPRKYQKKNEPDETITETLVQTSPVLTSKKLLEKGKISITIYKARNIEKKGMFGKADPYVNIMLDAQKAKSTTVKDNHNPEWNFTSTFDVDKNTTEKMKIEVFDEDLGKDDSLGSTLLDISSIKTIRHIKDQWIPLDQCKSGEILLSAEFVPFANIEAQKGTTDSPVEESVKGPVQEIDIEPNTMTEKTKPEDNIIEPTVKALTVPYSQQQKNWKQGN